MKFSERVKLAKEYDEWLKAFNESETDFQLKDCALTVITFLEEKGYFDKPRFLYSDGALKLIESKSREVKGDKDD